MKRLFIRAVVGMAALGAGGLAMTVGAPAAWAAVNCPPDIVNTTVNNSVTVPPGGNCVILNSTVTGNVIVGAGASITLVGATIKGSFISNGAHDIRIGDCGEFGCAIPRKTVVNGNVYITGTTGVPSFPTKNVICDATFSGGNVVLQNNASPFLIGSDPQCGFGKGATISGSLLLYNNSATVTLKDDTISGALQCTGNSPAPVNNGGNTAGSGTYGQCAGF